MRHASDWLGLSVIEQDDGADADYPVRFPDIERALRNPNGLLASGGELSPDWLISAYRQAVFPWYNPGEPILWWSPDPRFGFVPAEVKLGRSRSRHLRKHGWTLNADTCFGKVIRACAQSPRPGQRGTWIDQAMIDAYTGLHRLGVAHSIEVFDAGRLVGGLYGLAIGRMFFAESMFSAESGASALALKALACLLESWGWRWIDAQMENPHLLLLGGRNMDRKDYLALIRAETAKAGMPGSWQAHFNQRDMDACLHRR